MMRLRKVAATVFSMSALVSTACASTSVNRILADPPRYRDREVRVSGSVVDSYSFANRVAYSISDESAVPWIVSDVGVPRKSARVTVHGTIRERFNLGSLGRSDQSAGGPVWFGHDGVVAQSWEMKPGHSIDEGLRQT